MKCKFCGDECKAYRCEECKADVGAACCECHEEQTHGRIAPEHPHRDTMTRRMEDRYPDEIADRPRGKGLL